MASNHKAMIEYIRQTSGQANILTVPRIFIKMTGSIEAAIFLSQCVYLSDKTKRKGGDFYKSYKEWEEEIGLKRRQVDNARDTCKAFISTELHRANGAPTLHYRVNLEALADAIADFVQTVQPEQEEENPDLYKITNPFVQNEQIHLYETSKCLTETTHRLQQKEQQQQERPNIYKVYEQNIGSLTPLLADRLDGIDKDYPEGWFLEACKEAIAANVRRLDYIETILKSWKQNGFKVDTRKKQQQPRYNKPATPAIPSSAVIIPEGWKP